MLTKSEPNATPVTSLPAGVDQVEAIRAKADAATNKTRAIIDAQTENQRGPSND